MECRYELQVCQLDPLWRVTVRDRGRLLAEYCRDYPSLDEAVAYAKGRALQILATGDHARVMLAAANEQTVLWTTVGDVF
jgi:hypothetical protein